MKTSLRDPPFCLVLHFNALPGLTPYPYNSGSNNNNNRRQLPTDLFDDIVFGCITVLPSDDDDLAAFS